MPRTRLAPSPTGALHLGNLRTFLVNWALARQEGWSIVLRIDDLDGPRIKAAAAQQAIDLLRWFDVDWDEGPYYQKHDLTPYEAALSTLADQGDIYPCRCTRKEIEAAALSAPHEAGQEPRYPGTCRPQNPQSAAYASSLADAGDPDASPTAWRLRLADGESTFVDVFAGGRRENVYQATGDFLVATKAGLPSYQLAVVVDDSRQQIDQVIRGDDLLASTHRQLHLYDRLGFGPPPTYTHLPLVVGTDGRRLAKRHGDTRVDTYRRQGVSADRLRGLLAEWCGLGPRRPTTAAEFLERFELAKLPREAIVFRESDDQWLQARGRR